jgi:subtilisin-like proprotein convertase family protein
MAHQQSTAIQHGEVGDLEAFLEGPSGQRIHINLAIIPSCPRVK